MTLRRSGEESNDLDHNRLVVLDKNGKVTKTQDIANVEINYREQSYTGEDENGNTISGTGIYFSITDNPKIAKSIYNTLYKYSLGQYEWSWVEFKQKNSNTIRSRIATSFNKEYEALGKTLAKMSELKYHKNGKNELQYWIHRHSHLYGAREASISDSNNENIIRRIYFSLAVFDYDN